MTAKAIRATAAIGTMTSTAVLPAPLNPPDETEVPLFVSPAALVEEGEEDVENGTVGADVVIV